MINSDAEQDAYNDDECPSCLGTGTDDYSEMGNCLICGGNGFIRTYLDLEGEESAGE